MAAGPYSIPSSPFTPRSPFSSNDYDTVDFGYPRRQAPLDGAYARTQWSSYKGTSPFAQRLSPSSFTSHRRQSAYSPFADRFDSYTLRSDRSSSPESSLGRSPSPDGLREDWRPTESSGIDSSPSSLRPSLIPYGQYQSLQHRGSYDNGGPQLHPFIQYTYHNAPVLWDLRLDLRIDANALPHSQVPREAISSELSQLACEPPVPHLLLYHSRLPWNINVTASNGTGVTLRDLFLAIWTCLRCPIQHSDFWNQGMSDAARSRISSAWSVRCNGNAMEHGSGVRRVDFLRSRIMFEGLVPGRDGMWEMKTRTAGHSNQNRGVRISEYAKYY